MVVVGRARGPFPSNSYRMGSCPKPGLSAGDEFQTKRHMLRRKRDRGTAAVNLTQERALISFMAALRQRRNEDFNAKTTIHKREPVVRAEGGQPNRAIRLRDQNLYGGQVRTDWREE